MGRPRKEISPDGTEIDTELSTDTQEEIESEKEIKKEDLAPLGYLLEDDPLADTDETSTKEYVSSIVNGFRYNWPVRKARTLNEAVG